MKSSSFHNSSISSMEEAFIRTYLPEGIHIIIVCQASLFNHVVTWLWIDGLENVINLERSHNTNLTQSYLLTQLYSS